MEVTQSAENGISERAQISKFFWMPCSAQVRHWKLILPGMTRVQLRSSDKTASHKKENPSDIHTQPMTQTAKMQQKKELRMMENESKDTHQFQKTTATFTASG